MPSLSLGPLGRHVILMVAVVVGGLLALVPARNAGAQTLSSKLGTLLTEQQPTALAPDRAAAEVTRDTVSGLFAVELATLPLASSSGGFLYRLNPTFGVVERASDAFGPFFTERVIRNGAGQASVGFTYQFSTFGALQGVDLTSGFFPTNATRTVGTSAVSTVDFLQLDLEARTTTLLASYGVTDRFAIGAALPIAHVQFSGRRVQTANGVSLLQSQQSGSATGLGDVAINARYVLAGSATRGFAIGGDLRLPTGREADLLGSGEAGVRILGIGSWEDGQLAVHLNGGVGAGGASDELFWSTATTFAVIPRVTLVGEIMGRRLGGLKYLSDVYQPHSTLAGIETMRWLPTEGGVHTAFLVTGVKWNVARSFLLNTNVVIRLTDAGLRARFTPAISIDYDFER